MFLLRQSSPKHRMFAPLPCLWGWSPVQDSIRVSITSLLGLLVLAMTFFPSVAATHWVGKDDGEWQNTSCCPSYNGIEGFLSSQPLGWTSSPPYNWTSLQYNPDVDYSFWYQNGPADWFQTIIGTNGTGCATFNIQVYDIINGGPPIYQLHYPTNGCTAVGWKNAIFSWHTGWYITEYMTNNVITSVYFELYPFGGPIYSYTFYPQQSWIWIRSNVCWCGTDYGSTTYSVANGQIWVSSNLNLQTIDPPFDVGTKENSNMQYGCWQSYGSTQMYQSFSLSGHC